MQSLILKWKNSDLHLKAYLTEGETVELVISKEQYMDWFSNDKTVEFI